MTLTHSLKVRGLLVIALALLGTTLVFVYTVFANTTSALLPSSEGTYLQWTPKTGSTHYTMVRESSCNGTTDYNYATSTGKRDSYGVSIASVPNGSTITAIAFIPCASQSTTGGTTSTMNVFYRYSGAYSADAGAYTLSGTTPTTLATTTYSGLSLVKGSGSTLQIGAVVSGGTNGVRLSRIAAIITYTPLSAPTNLDAANVSGSENSLTWIDNASNEDGFKVERVLNAGAFTQVATTSANVVSYSDTGLTADQTYTYRVRAYNSGGNSYSNTDYAITATAVPAGPSNLTTQVTTSPNVILNWTDNSANEEGFKVERSTDDINYSEIAAKGKGVITHTDPNPGSGTYYYRVYAHNVIGNSGYSNTATAVIP